MIYLILKTLMGNRILVPPNVPILEDKETKTVLVPIGGRVVQCEENFDHVFELIIKESKRNQPDKVFHQAFEYEGGME